MHRHGTIRVYELCVKVTQNCPLGPQTKKEASRAGERLDIRFVLRGNEVLQGRKKLPLTTCPTKKRSDADGVRIFFIVPVHTHSAPLHNEHISVWMRLS